MSLVLPDGARGRALALAVTLIAILLLWVGAMVPLWGWYEARVEKLQRERTAISHMTLISQSVPQLKQQVAAQTATRPATVQLLEGASDGLAAAALQGRLENLANDAGAQIASAETLPAEPAGTWRAIAVRVTVTAPWATIVHLLAAIATAPTPLVADNLQVRVLPGGPREADSQIEATFTVTGYRAGRTAATP